LRLRRRARRRATVLLTTMALAGLTLSGMAGQPQAAQAAPTGLVAPYTWMPGNFGNGGGGTYLGRLASMNPATKAVSPYVFCISAGAATPVNPKHAGLRTGGIFAKLGYIMARHQGESGNYTPQAISYLAHLFLDTGNGGQSAAAAQALIGRNIKSAANGAAILARAEGLLWEAGELSGVPKVNLSWGRHDQASRVWPLNVQVRSANDKYRLSAPVTLTLTRTSGTGSATFKESGKASLTVDSWTNAARTVNVAYTGTGRWSVAASTAAVFPSGSLTVFGEAGHQSSIAVAPNTAAAAAATTFQIDQVTPAIATTSSITTQASAGQAVRDTIGVSGGWPGDTVTVTAELWRVADSGGPLPSQSATVPPGAVKVYTAPATALKLSAAGYGGLSVPAYTITSADAPGWYTWRVTTTGTTYTRAASAPFNVPAESFQVMANAVQIESTALVSGDAGPGDLVEDLVQLTGGVADQTVQVSATLVRLSDNPAAPQPTQSATRPAGAITIGEPFTQQVTFDSGGSALARFGPYTLTATDVGWFTWVIEVADSDNGSVTGGTSPYGVPSETFQVKVPVGPRVTTQASHQIADAGAPLTDHLRLWADPASLAGAPAVIESTLWGPYATPPGLGETWPMDPALRVGSVTTTMTAPGGATSPAITVDQRGYYVWTAKLAEGRRTVYHPTVSLAVSEGQGGVSLLGAVDGLAPSATLNATVELYHLSDNPTAPPPVTVPPGSQVSGLPNGGTWTVSGNAAGQVPWGNAMSLPDALFEDASGQVAAGWYGLAVTAPATWNMTALTGSPLDALVLVTEQAGAVSYGFGPTGVATGPTAGSLAMPVASSANQVKVYDQFTSSFGDAVETTLVPYTPQVTTQTSLQVASAGAELTDHLALSGAAPGVTYQITSVLYGPFEARPPRQATVPVDAPEVGRVVTELTADATGQASGHTAGLVVDQAGYYVWVETIAEDLLGSGSKGWTGEFGQSSETTVVPWRPVVTSQVDEAMVLPDGFSFDTLMVTGGQPNGLAVLEVSLYGPFAADPTYDYDGFGTYQEPRLEPSLTQLALPQSPPADAPVVANWSIDLELDAAGEATVTTPPIQLTEGGYYVYSAVLVPDDQAMVAGAERFGEVSETTLVPWRPAAKTIASHQVAEVGAELSDHVEVTNLGQNPATITALLYGPLPVAPELSATVPAGTPLAGSVTLQASGNGHYLTPTITVQQAGHYTWVETITAQEGTAVIETTTAFGIAEETTLINPPSQPLEVLKTPELPFTGLGMAPSLALGLALVLVAAGVSLRRVARR